MDAVIVIPARYASTRYPAKPLARLLGAGITSDAFHMVAPAEDGKRAGAAMKRAMETAPSGAIYNATDGHPSTMTDYFNQVADFASLPRPPQVSMAEAQASMSAGMLSYLQESRRIRNNKLLAELGICLHYPDLAAGLDLAQK